LEEAPFIDLTVTDDLDLAADFLTVDVPIRLFAIALFSNADYLRYLILAG
jgi:hypothetical protein